MKKSRIFLATGAFALAISAVFASKANKRFFTGLTTGVALFGDNVKIQAPSAVFTVTKHTGMVTAVVGLYTSAGGTKFFKTLLTVAGSKPLFMTP